MRYLLLINIFIVLGCSSVKDFPSFSNHLYKLQKSNKKCGMYPRSSYSQRSQIANKINFINFNKDTVYLLESYYLETGTFYSAIWTRKGKIEYKTEGEKVEIGADYFVKRVFYMIENWDTTSIKKEEKNSSDIQGGGMILGTRVLIEKGHLYMQCIRFKEFFDLKKDN